MDYIFKKEQFFLIHFSVKLGAIRFPAQLDNFIDEPKIVR